jgi:hypothetical protein
MTGMSTYILKTILKDFKRGLTNYIHGNENSTKMSLKVVEFICWFRNFVTVFGQSAPDDQVQILPSYLTRVSLYECYQDEVPSKYDLVNYSTFCKLLRTKFGSRREDTQLPWVRFSSYSTHREAFFTNYLNTVKIILS